MAKGKKTGGGSRRGRPNKATADVRACVALIAQNLAPEVEQWIRRGAKNDPLNAARVMAQLLEYHIPKLSRAEVSGNDGKALQIIVTRYGDDPPAA